MLIERLPRPVMEAAQAQAASYTGSPSKGNQAQATRQSESVATEAERKCRKTTGKQRRRRRAPGRGGGHTAFEAERTCRKSVGKQRHRRSGSGRRRAAAEGIQPQSSGLGENPYASIFGEIINKKNTKKTRPKNFKSVHTWTFKWEDNRNRERGRIFGRNGWRCQGITMNPEGHDLVRFPNTKEPPKKAPTATAAPVSETLAEVMHFLV